MVAVSDSDCVKIGVVLLHLSCLRDSEVTLDLVEPRKVTRAQNIQSSNLKLHFFFLLAVTRSNSFPYHFTNYEDAVTKWSF